jgi:hypothetical protein
MPPNHRTAVATESASPSYMLPSILKAYLAYALSSASLLWIRDAANVLV